MSKAIYRFLEIIGIIGIISFLSGVDLDAPYYWLSEDKRKIVLGDKYEGPATI